jgi:riboflavin biosynthesis pyrimidine reductase
MNRPYVTCHILSSLDGKINGPFMAAKATGLLGSEYGKIRTEMNADAWLYGTTTVKEFLNFREPVLDQNACVPDGDFVAGDKTNPYFVALDVKGELGWESGRFAGKGRTAAHVIEVLTEVTSPSYRAYLRERGVSYILAGKTELDCEIAMEKLHRLFHIEKLLICGGGAADWTFLQAGMVDELSLVLSPVTDGSSGNASVFARISDSSTGEPVEFDLESVKQVGSGGLHLNYLAKNTKRSD